MKEALVRAKIAFKKDEVPIGAVVVKNNEIIGYGQNRTIEKNVSELIHKRLNEEGPWPDAAKAYKELISKMETAEGSQKKILEKLQNFFASSNN